MLNRLSHIIILLLFQTGLLIGQDCKDLLRNYFDNLSNIKIPEEGKTYFMNFVVGYHVWNSGENFPKSETKVILTSKGYFMESEMVSVYSDENEYFIINHVQKQIIWNKGNLRSEKSQQSDTAMTNLQKRFVEAGNIELCADTILNKSKKKIIRISAPKSIVEKFMIKSITYQYSYEKQQIDHVFVRYTSSHQLKDQTIEYKALDLDYKKWHNIKASHLVIDDSGALLPKYKTYSIIDNK